VTTDSETPDTPPVVDFLPGQPDSYIRALALMCWQEKHVRADRVAAIAAAVAGGFRDFGNRLLGIIEGNEIPPSGTLFRLLGDDPILQKPALRFIAEIIYRFGKTDFDHIGTERDFWRLCHRDIVASYVDVMVSNFSTESLIADFIGRTDPEVGYAKVSGLPPYDVIMTEVTSLMLGNPMRAGLELILFETIRQNHDTEFQASLTLVREIILETVKIGPQRFGIRRQKEAWAKWKALSPLWAGILAEARPWHRETLIDVYSIQTLILKVLSNDERRLRAFEYAQWFRIRATSDAHKQFTAEYLVAFEAIVRLPRYIKAIEPKLVPLSTSVLQKARKLRPPRTSL
jgi:hypothetical protein